MRSPDSVGVSRRKGKKELCINCGQCLTHCNANAVYGTQSWVSKVSRADIYTVSIMPCITKKSEGMRPELRASGGGDIDATIDTRELAYMLKNAGIDLRGIPEGERDDLMGESSGGATLFGVTGGVMEAALRFACEAVTGQRPSAWDFSAVRVYS